MVNTDNETTTPELTEPHIVGHKFAGDVCKVEVQGHSASQLTSPEMKKLVYEYRHTVGASHMGLNRFEPAGSKQASTGAPVAIGYWYLMAGL